MLLYVLHCYECASSYWGMIHGASKAWSNWRRNLKGQKPRQRDEAEEQKGAAAASKRRIMRSAVSFYGLAEGCEAA